MTDLEECEKHWEAERIAHEKCAAQLRQEREAVPSQIIADQSKTILQAQILIEQLQTTVGQLRDVIRRRGQHAGPCFEDDNTCVCGITAALATCPAPAKEGE